MSIKCCIWVAVDCDGREFIYRNKPYARVNGAWRSEGSAMWVPHGTIRKLIGRDLKNKDTPVIIKDNR